MQAASIKVVNAAKSEHAKVWDDLVPVWKKHVGDATDKAILSLDITQSLPRRTVSFNVKNVSGVFLHNVVLYVDSSLGAWTGDASRHYVFIATIPPNSSIELASGLVANVGNQNPAKVIENCVTYCLWRTRYHWEKRRLKLFASKPTITTYKNGTTLVKAMLTPMK